MIARFARWLFARRDAMLFVRTLDPAEAADAPPGYSFAELTAADLRDCPLAQERGRLPKFEQRLADGYRCAGFRDAQGRVMSYIWIARGDAQPSSVAIWRDVRVVLQNHDVFFWDCRTAPAHEGRGLYRIGLRMAGATLARAGAERAFIETEPDNLASRRGIAGAGFAPVAELAFVSVVGKLWMRAAGPRWRRVSGPLHLGNDVTAAGPGSRY